MRTTRFALLLVLLAGAFAISTRAGSVQDFPAVDADDDRTVIEQNVAAYVEAYNAGDAARLSTFWTEEGVYSDRASGEQIHGREDLQTAFAAAFEEQPDSRLEVSIESIELVSPGVAIEEGRATTVSPESGPTVSSYTAVHVKHNGKWLIDRISEQEIVTRTSHYEHLRDLEWMIGHWVDSSDGGQVTTECAWTRNNNFIVRSFSVSMDGDVDLTGMQVIGWDAANEQIRSWTFDSDGGFNEGLWRQVGEQWHVQVTAKLPDGRSASSTSIFRPISEDSFGWQQVNRVADGQILPNLEEVVITRGMKE